MVRARKRFGQNFLIDDTVVQRIVGRFNDAFTIVEIGPGQGALTEGLLNTGAQVVALELDRDLMPLLQKKFAGYPNLQLQQADALKFDFGQLADVAPIRLAGNLPYNVATPLIFNLLDHLPLIVDMHFMLQWEVAARLTANAGDKHYGQLSVVMQNLCTTTMLIEVPPQAFSPAPKVNSAVIKIQPREKSLVPEHLQQIFLSLVKASFAQRRKTLRNNLKGFATAEQLTAAGIDPSLRAEVIDIAEFHKLAEIVHQTES
ncbi:MAG: 16S rRNA (adenine(1518)-N(6)/adenine(1519)-N(6))-dimethyltransferase RsmA [Pseudomonadota bacterium]